ncbi:MAG TPA: hypothetical protein VGO59_17930 [Verrucomicrobiae bacterium]|jgi:hypothetical protein
MNSNFYITHETARRRRGARGIALVITLLMLSVITFLAITFLYMSRRNQAAVTTSLDSGTARGMSDAGLARAQAEILAQMSAHGDPLDYDYGVSTSYRNPNGFTANEGSNDPVDVDYNSFTNGSPLMGGNFALNWAQNIANLQYDPEPPVFVDINRNHFPPTNYDFRFWVDVNRNGRFETNGYQPLVNDNGLYAGSYGFMNGEPEFIGVLRNPLFPHSSGNPFIGRYAYMILPVGKELDINYIHNFLKGPSLQNPILQNTSVLGNENDGFARDQGIGSWELNLAGYLDDLSPWAYENNNNTYPGYPTSQSSYNYVPPSTNSGGNPINTGNAFDDAEAILHYRYAPPYFLGGLSSYYSLTYTDYYNNSIDMLCQDAPLGAPFDYFNNGSLSLLKYATLPWPGSYQTNLFFDVQDLFDSKKTSANFTERMALASERTNSFDRYTFQRLISSMGMGSSPEYGVWVNRDFWTNSLYYRSGQAFNPAYLLGAQQANLALRTKVNINYDNTAQINASNAPYAPMPTNMTPWTPIGFFTNAAELLLRSQTFAYSNYFPASSLYNITYAQFGVTNIPIFRTNSPGVLYNPAVHRMLQLAANIYDATVTSNYASANTTAPSYRRPSIFRPVFGLVNPGTTNAGINIIGYQPVTIRAVDSFMSRPFYDLPAAYTAMAATGGTNLGGLINIWGIPWIVATDKGLPQFYQYSYQNSVLFERKTLFARFGGANGPDTNRPPQYTNQFYCFWVSNNFALDGWNPYPTNFTGAAGTSVYISNYVTVQLSNNFNFVYTTNLANVVVGAPTGSALNPFAWKAWGVPGRNPLTDSNGFITFLQTNLTTVGPCYYSPANNQLIAFTNGNWFNQFRGADTNQTAWPAYNWTLSVTNRLVYALCDGLVTGSPATGPNFEGPLLDFVNLGPFGSSTNLELLASNKYQGGAIGMSGSRNSNPWATLPGIPLAGLPGLLNQIATGAATNVVFQNNLAGTNTGPGTSTSAAAFGDPFEPGCFIYQDVNYVANDPMVHYTIFDLTNDITSALNDDQVVSLPASEILPFPPFTGKIGTINTASYGPWTTNGAAPNSAKDNMLLIDPMVCGANDWDFPTGKFPSVGRLGRVHRGTPWQSVYFKSDNPSNSAPALWSVLRASPWVTQSERAPETYPTNDWSLVDLFTTAPNDNAARGLLSVNQTNDAAWAALFAGVIAPSSPTNGVAIQPTNVFDLVNVNSAFGSINAWRGMTNANGLPLHPNGIFQRVGDILGAPALTVNSPFLTNPATICSDEVVERIPQQTLSLLKVGEPQFVIFSWGQSLKGLNPYTGAGPNTGIYTNYEITGEVLTRTVCHVVHTNGLKMVVDSFNIVSGSGN